MRMDALKILMVVLSLYATQAWAVRVPRSLTEHQVEDVEVCQDAICNKLREQILVEAYRCRPLAHFKMAKMQGQPSMIANSCGFFPEKNFRTSKGVCAKAVRAVIGKAGLNTEELKDSAYNLEKKGLLEQAGFVNLIWKYNEDTAPLGAILIYVGGRGHHYGHVEVRANPHLYCSDYCSPHPVSENSAKNSRRYKLAGVYVPFTSTIQAVAAR